VLWPLDMHAGHDEGRCTLLEAMVFLYPCGGHRSGLPRGGGRRTETAELQKPGCHGANGGGGLTFIDLKLMTRNYHIRVDVDKNYHL
jgi:hypothetical protein